MLPIRDTNRARRVPVMNWLLIAINAVVFFYEISLSDAGLQNFIGTYALVPARLGIAPVGFGITVLTSMFMHGGWWHFVSNMWILFIFGDNVEDRMGPLRYLIFYLIGGTAAALMETFIAPASRIPVLGASGAIAAVLGAYILLFPRARVTTLVFFFFITFIDIPAIIYLGFWFISQLFSGITSLGATAAQGVAWWAHIGGFVVGLLLCPLFARRIAPREIEFL